MEHLAAVELVVCTQGGGLESRVSSSQTDVPFGTWSSLLQLAYVFGFDNARSGKGSTALTRVMQRKIFDWLGDKVDFHLT
jgi:hypothetical protein